ncbi:MAG: RluA family pseudouridine synthase, partial [Flavobacteriales bacterium]|nr:RluA family pseudouridine synthase [Flavobacteriales bacterium]
MTEETSSQESEELYEHHRFIADKGQEPLRIDKFLLDRVPNTSRNRLQVAAKNGNILVNKLPVKSNYKVKPDDEISIVLPYPIREIELIPEDIPIDIVYEDDEVLVLNKQAGIVVHPGYGNYSGTLVNALVYHFENLPNGKEHTGRPGLVHRLDKNTTGIMVIAKTEDALTHLAKQFFDRTSKRQYNAIVWGDVEEDKGTVVGKVGRSIKNRKIMDVFDEESEYGKHAVTHYEVIRRYGYVTLVRCILETGRTHQIRIHMKHLGHPLFGDPEYGGNRILKGTTFSKYKSFIENCFKELPRQ